MQSSHADSFCDLHFLTWTRYSGAEWLQLCCTQNAQTWHFKNQTATVVSKYYNYSWQPTVTCLERDCYFGRNHLKCLEMIISGITCCCHMFGWTPTAVLALQTLVSVTGWLSDERCSWTSRCSALHLHFLAMIARQFEERLAALLQLTRHMRSAASVLPGSVKSLFLINQTS